MSRKTKAELPGAGWGSEGGARRACGETAKPGKGNRRPNIKKERPREAAENF